METGMGIKNNFCGDFNGFAPISSMKMHTGAGEAEDIFTIYNDTAAMEPDIPRDSYLFLKRVSPHEIEDGKVYLMVTAKNRFLAYVKKFSSDRFKLFLSKKSRGPAGEVLSASIKEAYLVLAYFKPIGSANLINK